MDINKVKITDYILDSITGDLYQHHHKKWFWKMNLGLHNRKQVGELKHKGIITRWASKNPKYLTKFKIEEEKNKGYQKGEGMVWCSVAA